MTFNQGGGDQFLTGVFLDFFMFFIQLRHWLSDALHPVTSHPLSSTSHPNSATSHSHSATSHQHSATSHPHPATSRPSLTASTRTLNLNTAAFCSELFSLSRNGTERNSESLLLFKFHGTEFRVVFLLC
jgi:hypothetical protein